MRTTAKRDDRRALKTYLEIAKFAGTVADSEGWHKDREIAEMTRYAYLVMLFNDLPLNVVESVKQVFTDNGDEGLTAKIDAVADRIPRFPNGGIVGARPE